MHREPDAGPTQRRLKEATKKGKEPKIARPHEIATKTIMKRQQKQLHAKDNKR